MAATGKQAVKFYGLAAKEGKRLYKRYMELNMPELVKDCDGDVDKVLTVVGELLSDDAACGSVLKIVSGYTGIAENDVTPQIVMSTVLGIVTDDDMGDSVASFLSFCEKMIQSSQSAQASTAVQTISHPSQTTF